MSTVFPRAGYSDLNQKIRMKRTILDGVLIDGFQEKFKQEFFLNGLSLAITRGASQFSKFKKPIKLCSIPIRIMFTLYQRKKLKVQSTLVCNPFAAMKEK